MLHDANRPQPGFLQHLLQPRGSLSTCINLLGNAKRNIITGPGLVNLDSSVYKSFRIRERFNTQIRAEFFNVLNHTNFMAPFDSNTIFDQSGNRQDGSAGVLDGTANDSREIQLAIKFTW